MNAGRGWNRQPLKASQLPFTVQERHLRMASLSRGALVCAPGGTHEGEGADSPTSLAQGGERKAKPSAWLPSVLFTESSSHP